MVRQRRPNPANVKGSPADINPGARTDLLSRIDRRLGRVNRHFAYQIKHGGSDEAKARTRMELKGLENEKKSVKNMEPIPVHVRKAERGA